MNKQQTLYTTAFLLLVFLLGGVLLPRTGLAVFTANDAQTVAILSLILIALMIYNIVGLSKAYK